MKQTNLRNKLIGLLFITLIIGSITTTNQVKAQDEIIYKGYLYEKDHLLLGQTAAIKVADMEKNITGGYGALIAVTDRGNLKNELASLQMKQVNEQPSVEKNYLYPGDELEVDLEKASITVSVLDTTNGGVKIVIKASEYMEVGKIPELTQIKSIETPENVNPGETFEINVRVKNSGVKRTEGITLALNANYSKTQLPFTPIESSAKTIPYLDGKEEKTLTFKAKANEEIPSNNYPLSIKAITLQDDEKIQTIVATTVKINEEPDYGNANLQKITAPKNLEPGDTYNLTLNIKNTGMKNTENLEITLQTPQTQTQPTQTQTQIPTQTGSSLSAASPNVGQSSGSILPVNEGSTKHVNILKPYRTKQITYKLKASEQASTGIHLLNFAVQYESDERPYQKNLQVGVQIEGKEDLTIVDTDYPEIHPGDEDIDLTTKIQNLGTRKAENIIAKPKLRKPFTANTNQNKQLGNLNQDQTSKINLNLDINEDIKSGKYQIPIELTYTVNNERITVERDMKVKITGKPNLEIVRTDYNPTEPTSGQTVTMIATIKNTGEKEIESVSFQGIEKVNQPISYSEDEDFIGSLDPGETAQGSLKLKFEDDAIPKTYQLETIIRGVKNEEVYSFTEYPQLKLKKGTKGIIQTIKDLLPF